MSIKAGQLIHTGNTVLAQRLQTAGPGSLNIPTQTVKELGNYQSVAVTHDTPDLTFSMESWDVSPALEAMVTDIAVGAGPYAMGNPKPLYIASEWLAGQSDPAPFAVVEGIAIPACALESIQYAFGLRATAPASKTFNFRSDSIFFCPGAVVVEEFVGSGTGGQVLTLGHPAGKYNGDVIQGMHRSLAVAVSGARLFFGVDYTEGYTSGHEADPFVATTVTLTDPAPSGSKIIVEYFTNATVSFLQAVHADPSVKPAAIRGKDITVLVNGVEITDRWAGVQSVQVGQQLTVDKDEEFGSAYASVIDYLDVPTVTGNLVIRAKNPTDFHARLVQAMQISTATEAIGATQFADTRVDFVLHHPDTGDVLETLEVPDAVFTLPPFSGRINTKLDVTIPFQSDSGTLSVLDDAPS